MMPSKIPGKPILNVSSYDISNKIQANSFENASIKRIFLVVSPNHQKQPNMSVHLSRKPFHFLISVQVVMKLVKRAEKIVLKVLVGLLG